MRTGIFVIGAVIMVIGLAIVAYDKPRAEAIESIAGGFAMVNEGYQNLLREIFIGQMLIVIGILIIIPGIILKKKDLESDKDKHPEENPTKQGLKNISLNERLRNSPSLQGILIGIIAVAIFWGIFSISFSHTYTMSNDALSPDVMKGDLMHYNRVPFTEVNEKDIIAYISSDNEFGVKVGIVRDIAQEEPRILHTSNNVVPTALSPVSEKDYVGKITSITSQGGIFAVYTFPYNLLITLVLFASPIIILKIGRI